MIVRTYRQCIKAVSEELVFVATDDARIKSVCDAENIQVIMTSSSCLTGTDRVAEAAASIDEDTFINVQGDEPVFNPDDIQALIAAANAHPEEVINGYCPIYKEDQFRSGNTPKVVMRPDGRLLYMSRGAIPTTKSHGFSKSWRQVCAYVFPRRALEAFASAPSKTVLETIEDIEILRFLELGWDVRMVHLSDLSVPVDDLNDVAHAESEIRKLGLA